MRVYRIKAQMSERQELPAGTSPALRERFYRLSPGDRARVLARLAAGIGTAKATFTFLVEASAARR